MSAKFGYLLLALWLFTFLHCDVETGLEPTRSGISGTVYFSDEWPSSTDEVMVVAATTFPPTTLNDIIMSEPLPTFVDSASYVIWANPATFEAVGVVWKQVDQPWDVTNIIGIYFPTSDHFSPGQVTITNRGTLVDSVDIEADLSNARLDVDSAIEGTLRIQGEWPANAQHVLMVASQTVLPTSLLDITFGVPIEAGFDSTMYSLSVQPGTYRLIGSLVVQEGESLSIESIKGIYRKKAGDVLPGSVVVPTDTTRVSGIDITLDFEGGLLP